MDRQTIGSRIRALRTQRRPKPTQYEVADAVGITRAHLAKIETGADAPGRATLSAFATYFGVSMDYLETGAETPDPQFAQHLPDSADKRAWMLLGEELSQRDKVAVAEFVRSTILRDARGGRRRKG